MSTSLAEIITLLLLFYDPDDSLLFYSEIWESYKPTDCLRGEVTPTQLAHSLNPNTLSQPQSQKEMTTVKRGG